MRHPARTAAMWALVLLLALASFAAPRVWQLGQYLPGPFFTGDAYATMAGGLLAGVIVGIADRRGAFGWGAIIGTVHLVLGLGYLGLRFGAAALDPIGIGLLIMMSFLPPLLGALLGASIRR